MRHIGEETASKYSVWFRKKEDASEKEDKKDGAGTDSLAVSGFVKLAHL